MSLSLFILDACCRLISFLIEWQGTIAGDPVGLETSLDSQAKVLKVNIIINIR